MEVDFKIKTLRGHTGGRSFAGTLTVLDGPIALLARFTTRPPGGLQKTQINAQDACFAVARHQGCIYTRVFVVFHSPRLDVCMTVRIQFLIR